VRRGLSPACHLDRMIKLQELARRAPAPGRADEGALAAVALPNGALDRGGDVPCARGRAPPARARLLGRRELAPLEPADQGVERLVEDFRDVPRGELVAEERLGVAQLVVRALPDGDLE